MSDQDLQELERVVVAARDALTDEMVSRVAATTAEGLDLLDRVNRSGVAGVLPALAELVRNGDLERLVGLARTYGAAQDALSDEIVGRLAEAASGGLELLERANRAELGRAIPVLARLVANGDLERLTHLARVLGAAEDALSDEMITRLAEAVGGAISLADRVQRAGADRLIGALERLAAGGALDRLDARLDQLGQGMELLERVLGALEAAAREAKPASGGIGGLWRLLSDAENQRTLRYLLALGRQLRTTGKA